MIASPRSPTEARLRFSRATISDEGQVSPIRIRITQGQWTAVYGPVVGSLVATGEEFIMLCPLTGVVTTGLNIDCTLKVARGEPVAGHEAVSAT